MRRCGRSGKPSTQADGIELAQGRGVQSLRPWQRIPHGIACAEFSPCGRDSNARPHLCRDCLNGHPFRIIVGPWLTREGAASVLWQGPDPRRMGSGADCGVTVRGHTREGVTVPARFRRCAPRAEVRCRHGRIVARGWLNPRAATARRCMPSAANSWMGAWMGKSRRSAGNPHEI